MINLANVATYDRCQRNFVDLDSTLVAFKGKRAQITMSVTLDLRMPSVVIVGFWNQVILNEPGWIAQYILEAEDGQEIEIGTIIVGDNQAPRKTISVFDKFGISCTQQRLELYQTGQGTADDLCDVIGKIAELLPHTPVSAIGVNYHFLVANEVDAISSSIETNEAFDGVGIVKDVERTESIELNAESQLQLPAEAATACILKLKRQTDFGSAHVDFNFHQQVAGISTLSAWKDQKPIDHWLSTAESVLGDLYGVTEWETSAF